VRRIAAIAEGFFSRCAVTEWVRAIGGPFTAYAAAFEENRIDGASLLLLDDGDLTALGVDNRLHRRRLTAGIATLRMAAGLSSAFDGKAPAASATVAAATEAAATPGGPDADADGDAVMNAAVTVSRAESEAKAAKDMAAAAEAKAAAAAEAVQCVICHDSPKAVLFDPCGHVSVCEECSKRPALLNCPLCRTLITGRRKAFV
jgi:hypothetical protein